MNVRIEKRLSISTVLNVDHVQCNLGNPNCIPDPNQPSSHLWTWSLGRRSRIDILGPLRFVLFPPCQMTVHEHTVVCGANPRLTESLNAIRLVSNVNGGRKELQHVVVGTM